MGECLETFWLWLRGMDFLYTPKSLQETKLGTVSKYSPRSSTPPKKLMSDVPVRSTGIIQSRTCISKSIYE